MNAITTVRRNSTLARSILSGKVKTATAYSLSNGFSGTEMTAERFAEMMAHNAERDIDCKITTGGKGDGVYTVRIHSNHWYEVTI